MNAVHKKERDVTMPKIIENPQAIILEHAGRILEEQGYEALSMRAIAKSCGIATGTIYNYFPTKRELLLQMMTDYWEMHFTVIDNLSAGRKDLFAKLKCVFDIMEKFVFRFRDVWAGMRQENENNNGAGNMHHSHDYMRRLVDLVELILVREEQCNSSAFNYPLPTRELASFIVQNYLAICHMKKLSYSSWELLLKKVLQ
jgi:AcrR family transcriptional regulator